MVYAHPGVCLEECDKLLWDFEIQTGHIISLRRPNWLVGWLTVLFNGISKLFVSFNTEFRPFDNISNNSV